MQLVRKKARQHQLKMERQLQKLFKLLYTMMGLLKQKRQSKRIDYE